MYRRVERGGNRSSQGGRRRRQPLLEIARDHDIGDLPCGKVGEDQALHTGSPAVGVSPAVLLEGDVVVADEGDGIAVNALAGEAPQLVEAVTVVEVGEHHRGQGVGVDEEPLPG